jgi:hypothetical protein
MAGLSAIGGQTSGRVDRGYSCPADALLFGWMLTIGICTAAAPPVCPAGCTKAVTVARTCSAAHRLRLPIPPPLCRRATGRRLDRHVAGRPREGRTRSCPATTAMWPAVLTGGRPSFEAAGQLPAGSALVLCRSASGGNIYQIKRPATGRWRTNKRQRVDAKQPRAAARTEPG